MIYLVNFPSQDAVKGQEFLGDSSLEAELVKRGIIGNGEPTVAKSEEVEIFTAEIKSLKAKLVAKSEEVETLKSIVEEAIASAKGTVPESYKAYLGDKNV
jgi:hypothetical protein